MVKRYIKCIGNNCKEYENLCPCVSDWIGCFNLRLFLEMQAVKMPKSPCFLAVVEPAITWKVIV